MDTFIATALLLIITTLVYARVGFANITNSYRMWFEDGYWVNYNVVEAFAWLAKAASNYARSHLAKGNMGATHCYLAHIGASHLGL